MYVNTILVLEIFRDPQVMDQHGSLDVISNELKGVLGRTKFVKDGTEKLYEITGM